MERQTGTLPREEIEEMADNLTSIYSEPPIPVCEVARRQHMRVFKKNFGKHTNELSGFCDMTKGHIYINNDDMRLRQVFTIAHEIGHWILHKGKIGRDYTYLPKGKSEFNDKPYEVDADYFAIALLMPRHLLKKYDRVKEHVTLLAKVFNVERTMMELRLRGE